MYYVVFMLPLGTNEEILQMVEEKKIISVASYNREKKGRENKRKTEI